MIVAGGGIAGLALTRALRLRGLSATTLERRPAGLDAGLAINLPGNAIRALAALGLREEVERLGPPIRRREYRTAGGRLLFEIDEDAFWGPDARPRVLRRVDLLRLLASGAPKGAEPLQASVASARQWPDGVEVELSDGAKLSAHLLVGADGVRSAVRRAVTQDKATVVSILASASWRFMAPNCGVDCWTVWAGARSMILLLPIDGHRVYGWAAAAGSRAAADSGPLTPELFDSFPGVVRRTVEAALAAPGAVHLSPLEEVTPPNWGDTRIVLIGDAAHATAPVWAQGAGLAMEDALVLADLLADRTDWNGVAEEFARLRAARIRHVGRMTDRMSRSARLPVWLRDALMPLLGPRSYRATYGPLKS